MIYIVMYKKYEEDDDEQIEFTSKSKALKLVNKLLKDEYWRVDLQSLDEEYGTATTKIFAN